ncbi:MAG: mycothiol maleylpyruvate isomerase [Frondihabitans sp.]|nr:mycothiol maleylpyruvate isomerase [Frondihabitans sp.]
MSSTSLFSQAAESFVQLVGQIDPEQWDEPGLGSWTVRDLTGHTTRAILTVVNYLGQEESGDVTVPTAEHYYTVALTQFGDDASVATRGVEAGVWLGDNPLDRIRPALAEARVLLGAQLPNRIVTIGGLGIPLAEYLRTRAFELTVHTLDLSRATGIAHDLSPVVLTAATTLAASTAVARGHGEEVLLALTGREPLPDGFSVV